MAIVAAHARGHTSIPTDSQNNNNSTEEVEGESAEEYLCYQIVPCMVHKRGRRVQKERWKHYTPAHIALQFTIYSRRFPLHMNWRRTTRRHPEEGSTRNDEDYVEEDWNVICTRPKGGLVRN